LGITQKELAKELGLTDRTLSKYANEKMPLHIKKHLLLMVKDKNNRDSMKNLKHSINTLHSLINDK
jgi:transcriptional regulator with XRE-family HTH domain